MKRNDAPSAFLLCGRTRLCRVGPRNAVTRRCHSAAFLLRHDRLSSPPKAEEDSCKSELPVSAPWARRSPARLIEVGHQVTVWNRTPDKAKPLAEAGAKVATIPAEVAAASEAVDHPAHRRRGDRRGLQRAERAAVGRRQGQAVHRDEHGAAQGRDRSRAQGARQGRGDGRMPGRRLDHAGARGQAARADGRASRPTPRARGRSSSSFAARWSIAGRSAPARP